RRKEQEIEEETWHAAEIVGERAVAFTNDQGTAAHGVEIEEGGNESEADRRENAGKKLPSAAHPVNEKFQRMIGGWENNGYRERSRPWGLGFAERFGESAVKARADGAEKKLSLHGGKCGGKARGEIGKEKNSRTKKRAEEGRLPIPPPDQSGERIAGDAAKGCTDRAGRREHQWKGGRKHSYLR